MSPDGVDVDRIVERVNGVVVGRPGTVVVAFLLLTALLAGGLPLLTTQTDITESFIEDLDEQQALEAINEEFRGPFEGSEESTQVIHAGEDVLSQQELVRSLAVLERAEERGDLRISSATGPAPMVAQELDPEAETFAEQRRAVERASTSEVREAVRSLSDDPRFAGLVSEDFNSRSASASASIAVVSHDLPDGASDDELQSIQVTMRSVADASEGDFRVFGEGIINDEFGSIIGDSLTIVVPAVVLLILLFLIVAYRDPIDLALGLVALVMTIVWTFGAVGYVGIPFDVQMVAIPVLLLAVGIDFGIHIINRYREEHQQGRDRVRSMTLANRQLLVAFFIVAVTTVFGFGANVVSELEPTRNFGIVASIGIVFTFLIFGLFLPSAKLLVDDAREQLPVPEFGSAPLATEESALGRLLSVGATATRVAPILFVILFVVIGGAAGAYGQDVDRTFDVDDFLPPEELPDYVTDLPEPFAPGEYTVTRELNFLEENFAASQQDSVTMYVVGPFGEDHSLESIHRTNDEPPDAFATTGGRADPESVLDVIDAHAERDPEFAALVDRNDRNGNGVPDRNLDRIYDELFASPSGDQARSYLTEDRRATRLEYDADSSASQSEITGDAREFADRFRYDATPTGQIVVYDAVSDIIYDSAIRSLVLAIVLTSVFLVVIYAVIEGRPLLGVVNVFPIVLTVALLVATMRARGIPLNALTATILSITIGIGIDYSMHTTHRFIDEYQAGKGTHESLVTTLSGTGGALTGSMLTTSIGAAALVLAITPVLGTFGILMAISVFYSYLTSLVALPPALYLWARVDGWRS